MNNNSNYKLNPIKINFDIIAKYEYTGMCKEKCEFYCPMVKNGPCRFCTCYPNEHKKYFMLNFKNIL